MRRGFGLALLLCLAGAVLLLIGAGATWTEVRVPGRAPLPDSTRAVPGSDLVPGLRALGVVALAGVPALLAARRWGRVAVGALLLAGGALAAVLTVRVLTDFGAAVFRDLVLPAVPGADPGERSLVLVPAVDPTVWPYAVVVGAALLVAAGLLTVLRGRTWAALGGRYEPPAVRAAAPAPEGDKQVWEALDRGEDPTG